VISAPLILAACWLRAASPVTAQTEADIAELAIAALFGDAPPGSAQPDEKTRYQQRVLAILERATGSVTGPPGAAMKNRYCVERYVRFQGITGADVDTMCATYWKYYDSRFDQADMVRGLLLLEALLPALRHEAAAKAHRTRYLKTMGWHRVVHLKDNAAPGALLLPGGTRLVENPPEAWSYRTVRYALSYGRQHHLDPEFLAGLEVLLPRAPRHRCVKGEAYLLRDGQAQEWRYAPNYLEGTVVECAEAPTQSDPQLMKALPVPAPMDDRTRWLGLVPAGKGREAGSALKVTVYWEQEH